MIGFCNVFKEKVSKITPKNRIILAVITVVLITAIVAFSVFGVRAISFHSAFNSSKSSYKNAQITIKQKVVIFNIDYSPENTVGSDDKTEVTNQDKSYETTTTVKINGDKYYEESEDYALYLFSENGKDYVLSYDQLYGKKSDSYAWTKSEVNEDVIIKSFDFNVLDDIELKRLHYKDGEYKPEYEYWNRIFAKIKNSSQLNMDIYDIENISIEVQHSKISKIKLEYILDGLQSISEEYSFSYEKEIIEIPSV